MPRKLLQMMLIPFTIESPHNGRAMKTIFVLVFSMLAAMTAWCDEQITVDARGAHHDFPHYWEQMFGSGRAILTLRESYRRDLQLVKSTTDFKFVRFHAILHDEVGMYDEDKHGKPLYNFTYVDQIYDGLLANGVRPYVELSFMPGKLASRQAVQSFKYHPIVAPPRDYAKWDALIAAFAAHLIDRYGIDEVAQWYFEVWNEPNIAFWAGEPKQRSYFALYDHTAQALKKVDARLRVGGPSTAQAAWVGEFIRHCTEHGIPVDFVSTHVYANDTAKDVFGTHEIIPRAEMVCRAARKVRGEVDASPRRGIPIFWSEYNASYFNDPKITDSLFMGPWLADTLRRCDGLTDMMSYWTFSDVFEEQGVAKRPFYGGFGLIASGGIAKPAFNAFKMLHGLGTQRYEVDSEHALVTRRMDGSFVIALWNYVAPGGNGAPLKISLRLSNLASRTARVVRLDADDGDVNGAYLRMGSPAYPSAAQLQQLLKAAALPAPRELPIENGSLSIVLPPQGLATVEFAPGHNQP
jgi:xylan 1,4-beta-xylosidase